MELAAGKNLDLGFLAKLIDIFNYIFFISRNIFLDSVLIYNNKDSVLSQTTDRLEVS